MTNEPVDFNQEPNDVEAPPAVEPQVEMEDAKEENPPLQRTGSDRPKSPASPFSHKTDNQAYTLSWHDLDFEVEVSSGPCGAPEKKKIVKNASGVLKPGRLTAIMGPSGAGKSSMMNVLAGRAPYGQISAGQIMLNGKVADPTVYRQELAYVMQHDALFATQTPREVLTFTATLRLPDMSESEREQIVTHALEVLGLEKCADTYIGSAMIPGLSGGEKKRVAVAVELIASPSLIFLDEPTSGLDSHTAYELVSTLRSLAESGCTIVCTIHQPSSETYALFHDVIMLKSGWIAYSGKASKVGDFFEDEKNKCPNNSNPCDFAMYRLQMMSDDEVLPYVERVPKVAQPESKGVLTEADLSGHPNAGPFAQLVQLVKREVLNLVRDTPTLGARFGVSIVLSLLLGCIYFKVGDEWGDDGDDIDITNKIRDHWGAIQFAAINAMFASAQPMLLAFPLERAAFIRESTVGTYSALSYVAAKTLVELPASFLQMLLQTLIFYFMVDLQGSFIFIVLALTAVSAVSTSLALLLGCATTSAETAVQLVPLVYVPQILFSGVFISTDQMPVWMSWLQWICPLKYGVALVTTAEFGAQYVPDNREAAVADLVGRNDINRDEWWVVALLTLGLFLGYRIGGTVLLWYRASKFE